MAMEEMTTLAGKAPSCLHGLMLSSLPEPRWNERKVIEDNGSIEGGAAMRLRHEAMKPAIPNHLDNEEFEFNVRNVISRRVKVEAAPKRCNLALLSYIYFS